MWPGVGDMVAGVGAPDLPAVVEPEAWATVVGLEPAGAGRGVAFVDDPPQPAASATTPITTATRPAPECRLFCMPSRSTANVKP